MHEHLQDRARCQARVNRRGDILAELRRALQQAQGGEGADHAVGEGESGSRPDASKHRFRHHLPEARSRFAGGDLGRGAAVAMQAGAHRLALLPLRLTCRHAFVSLHRRRLGSLGYCLCLVLTIRPGNLRTARDIPALVSFHNRGPRSTVRNAGTLCVGLDAHNDSIGSPTRAPMLLRYLRPNSAGRNVESPGHWVTMNNASSIASTNGQTAREISSKDSLAMLAAT